MISILTQLEQSNINAWFEPSNINILFKKAKDLSCSCLFDGTFTYQLYLLFIAFCNLAVGIAISLAICRAKSIGSNVDVGLSK